MSQCCGLSLFGRRKSMRITSVEETRAYATAEIHIFAWKTMYGLCRIHFISDRPMLYGSRYMWLKFVTRQIITISLKAVFLLSVILIT